MIKKTPKFNFAKPLMLFIIIAAVAVVIFTIIFALNHTPEKEITRKLDLISRDYYENYLYPGITDKSALEQFKTSGFSAISLSQLLLYDNQKWSSERDFFEEYCDLSTTTVKFYPESPYEKTDYRLELSPACDF